MAVSVANRHFLFRGQRTLMYAEITLDSAYASGGEEIEASLFGFKAIDGIFPAGNTSGYVFEFTKSDFNTFLCKVYSFSNTTNTVLGAIVTGKDLSAVTIPVLIVGR